MAYQINRQQRIRKFTFLFLGVVWDFWRESRIAKRHGGKIARERMSARHRRRAIQFRQTAIEMGGVLIKLGQFFSSRVDVMPTEYIEELAKLQDEVPPVPFEEIKQVIEEEFNQPLEQLFAEFESDAHAAASLAQVHKAKLPSGQAVAVKIQRPGIRELVDIDLATFSYLIEGVQRFTNFGRRTDLNLIVSEFTRTLNDELDFFREAANAVRFRENFANDPIIYIPKIYWQYTRDRVITLEAIDGIKISDYQAIEKAGLNRHQIAHEIVQSYLKQVMDDGFFHADPHPGNLFVAPGPIITFVDFGMVGEINPEMKLSLRQAIIGIAKKDARSVIEGFAKLGFIRQGADVDSIERAINWMFDHYSSISSHNITYENVREIEDDILKIIHDEPLTVPAQFAFLGRALSTLLGLATGLDPDFDFIEATKPYVAKLTSFSMENWQQIILNEVKSLAQNLWMLPKQVQDTLDKLQRGTIKVTISSSRLTRAIEKNTAVAHTTSYTTIALSLVAAIVALLYFDLLSEAYVLMAFLGLVLLLLARR
jgi:predicted unusual protein kinase regulating ubiquinone biosynthesis (AarF/ABC1/UbiB family)